MAVSPLILRQFPQFAAWPDASLARLAGQVTLKRLSRRQLALTPGELGHRLAWVVEGSVWLVDHTLDDREFVLGRFAAGELFGELHAFGRAARMPPGISYVAAENGAAAVTDKTALWNLMAEEPRLGQHMVGLLAERMGDFFRWRSIFALPSAPERVAATLAALAEDAGEAGLLPAGMTQQEIAAHANTTRETVTRVMQRLQGEGAVRRDGAHWRVDATRLRAVAAGLR